MFRMLIDLRLQKLFLIDGLIDALFLTQLLVTPVLNDPALVDHKDLIRVLNRADTVGDDDRRLALPRFLEAP